MALVGVKESEVTLIDAQIHLCCQPCVGCSAVGECCLLFPKWIEPGMADVSELPCLTVARHKRIITIF